jgi:hypothetical protein
MEFELVDILGALLLWLQASNRSGRAPLDHTDSTRWVQVRKYKMKQIRFGSIVNFLLPYGYSLSAFCLHLPQ